MKTTPTYFMESQDEGRRLAVKIDRDSTKSQLLKFGFDNLPAKARVLDAGSGSGQVAYIMADILSQKVPDATLTLMDFSVERLGEAKKLLQPFDRNGLSIKYVNTELEKISSESNQFDFIFCRFVFEYLSNPTQVMNELVRITKPGGKLVVADLDYNLQSHYPVSPQLAKCIDQCTQELIKGGYWDPYAGRKIYSQFHRSGLKDIRVVMETHHLSYGFISESEEFNWFAKLGMLKELQKAKKIVLDFDVASMELELKQFLHSPDRFSYSPLVLVEGIKP